MKLTKDDQDQQTNLPDSKTSGMDDTRRKFNKAGAIAPVLLSLSSKPVWAVDCGVSGTMSGNLSQGCSPPPEGFTVAQFIAAKAWPLPFVKESTTFDSVFGPCFQGSLFGSGTTMLSVMSGDATIILSADQLKRALSYKGSTEKLKKSLMKYAAQSSACALNKALFPHYSYSTSSFCSAISGDSSGTDDKKGSSESDDKRVNLINQQTDALARLRI
jgi:hypothetical protein